MAYKDPEVAVQMAGEKPSSLQTNGMPDLNYSEENFRDMYEALKHTKGWLTTMNAYIPLHGIVEKIIDEALDKADRLLSGIPQGGLAEAAQKAGAEVTVVELRDTKINLCDTCTEKNDYPICCPPDIEFGNGKGNDNIIQCSKYILGTAKPCSIPLNVLITPETALAKGEESVL